MMKNTAASRTRFFFNNAIAFFDAAALFFATRKSFAKNPATCFCLDRENIPCRTVSFPSEA